MTKEQNSRKIIRLPLGNAKREIEQSAIAGSLAATPKRRAAGGSLSAEFLTRSPRRWDKRELSRKTWGIRWDRIQALKERIEAGEYRVEPGAVAAKILEHAICELARGVLPGYTSRCRRAQGRRRTPASL